jgi:hypothetical protein
MAMVTVTEHQGMILVYDTEDVARIDFSAPHDVEYTAPGRAALGTAHLHLNIDFLPGKCARWIKQEG